MAVKASVVIRTRRTNRLLPAKEATSRSGEDSIGVKLLPSLRFLLLTVLVGWTQTERSRPDPHWQQRCSRFSPSLAVQQATHVRFQGSKASGAPQWVQSVCFGPEQEAQESWQGRQSPVERS